jgi:hypothetical protein
MIATDILSIAWLDCQCMVLSCMDKDVLVIYCPKHNVSNTRQRLIDNENRVYEGARS